ncbi:MAG: AMP-binding protein [Xanthomonadales bacterium]|nr:AMP-binding protein [Xanthomonadales bacterium]
MKVPLTIIDHLRRAEQVFPDRIAYIDEADQPASSWGTGTYREMARRAGAQAAGLDALGIERGARVAIVSQNSARLLTAFYGVSAWGRILAPINFRLVAAEIDYIVKHCGAEVLLVDPELDDALKNVTAKHRFVIGSESDELLYRFDTEPEPWNERDEDATATINYTSGTTARPKGVQLTHRNLWLNAASFGWHLGVNERDVYLHLVPQFHCNGWGMVYALTAMGGKHIIQRKVDGMEILRRVEEHGVTLMCGAPAVVNMILDAAQHWPGKVPGFGRIRMVVAGAPPPHRTIERMESELGWEMIQIYGLTETSPLLTMNRLGPEFDDKTPAEKAARLVNAGTPCLGVETRVDKSGEVLARSNTVMGGYWNQPEETNQCIVDGWFHTGDGGHMDENQLLTIADRKKDVIISGGENISSIEVEDAVFSHPDVTEVAVIGVPDEKWGELVLALVVKVADSELTEQELIAFVKTRLASYKCPKRIEFRSELARTATGKLQKFKLREPYWQGFERQVN